MSCPPQAPPLALHMEALPASAGRACVSTGSAGGKAWCPLCMAVSPRQSPVWSLACDYSFGFSRRLCLLIVGCQQLAAGGWGIGLERTTQGQWLNWARILNWTQNRLGSIYHVLLTPWRAPAKMGEDSVTELVTRVVLG